MAQSPLSHIPTPIPFHAKGHDSLNHMQMFSPPITKSDTTPLQTLASNRPNYCNTTSNTGFPSPLTPNHCFFHTNLSTSYILYYYSITSTSKSITSSFSTVPFHHFLIIFIKSLSTIYKLQDHSLI